MKIEITKKGFPALWECGGGMSNTGRAQIIAGPDGERLPAIYVRRAGSLACSDHALVGIKAGVYVINARHHRGDFEISVQRITAITEVKCENRGARIASSTEEEEIRRTGKWGSWSIRPALPEEGDRQGKCPDCGAQNWKPGTPVYGGPAYFLCQGFKPSAALETLCEFSQGEWDTEPADELAAAVDAAKQKAHCYHCREPHFIRE